MAVTSDRFAQRLRRRQVMGGAALAVMGLPAVARAAVPLVDRILIEKSARRMWLFRDERELYSFRVALGPGLGPKRYQGDGCTPEGRYYVDDFRPNSAFYRGLHISYPNAEDRARAAALGRPPGGQIMIHGLDPGIAARWQADHWMFNWTQGCVAVTNQEMDLIWNAVRLGTSVEIRP